MNWQTRHWRTKNPGPWPPPREGILIRLDTDGLVGWGEASPLPGFGKDSVDRAQAALEQAFELPDWEEIIADADLAALHAVSMRVARVSAAAACGLETAVLDLISKRIHSSIGEHLAWYHHNGNPRRVPFNLTLGPREEASAPRLQEAWDDGVRAIKLKIGRQTIHDDIRRAEELRNHFGKRLELRLDANGSYSLNEVQAALAHFAPFEPRFCEQPVPPGSLQELPALPFPHAADESLIDPGERAQILQTPALDLAALILKPMFLGGALECLRIAREVESLQRRPGIVITHTFEGPIGFALACELASALPDDGFAAGLAPHPNLAFWGIETPHLDENSAGSALEPGLGINPDSLPE